MNPSARILLLCGALFLLVFGVLCLKQRVGREPIPPAFVTGDGTGQPGNRGFEQPTILSAEPGNESDFRPALREIRPTPIQEDANPSQEIPININAPAELPQTLEPSLEPPAALEPVPSAESDAAFSAPVESAPIELAAHVAPEAPQSVVTVENDSFWSISERVYGSGEYYKTLYVLNRSSVARPDRIAAGVEIFTPRVEELQSLAQSQ